VSTHYLTFGVPTSVNKLYAPRYGGGLRLTNEAKTWKDEAIILARNQWGYDVPLIGHLAITYHFFGTKLDWDNGCKILSDSMNGIVYYDDKQIIQAHIYMHRQERKNPHVDVEIQTIG